MYRDGKMSTYLDDAAAGIPAPGGGSVSAFAAALGTTMGSMAANFTVGKKKFADVEGQVKEILGRLDEFRAVLLQLAEEDIAAYGGVSAAYGMPRSTPEEKKARGTKIQEVLVTAMDVPLRTVRACIEVLAELQNLVDVANPNLISDVGVSAILAEAALRGAKLNVEINIAALKDEALVQQTADEMCGAAGSAARMMTDVMTKVERKISG